MAGRHGGSSREGLVTGLAATPVWFPRRFPGRSPRGQARPPRGRADLADLLLGRWGHRFTGSPGAVRERQGSASPLSLAT